MKLRVAIAVVLLMKRILRLAMKLIQVKSQTPKIWAFWGPFQNPLQYQDDCAPKKLVPNSLISIPTPETILSNVTDKLSGLSSSTLTSILLSPVNGTPNFPQMSARGKGTSTSNDTQRLDGSSLTLSEEGALSRPNQKELILFLLERMVLHGSVCFATKMDEFDLLHNVFQVKKFGLVKQLCQNLTQTLNSVSLANLSKMLVACDLPPTSNIQHIAEHLLALGLFEFLRSLPSNLLGLVISELEKKLFDSLTDSVANNIENVVHLRILSRIKFCTSSCRNP